MAAAGDPDEGGSTPGDGEPGARLIRPGDDLDTEELAEVVEGVLEGAGVDPKVRTMVVQSVRTSHKGPLPSPQTLAGYEQILPGCADRIVSMAEGEQAHRHAMDRKAVDTWASLARVGQIFAFIIAVVAIACGAVLVGMDKPLEGFVLIFVPIAGLVTVFVKSQRSPREQDGEGDSGDKQRPSS